MRVCSDVDVKLRREDSVKRKGARHDQVDRAVGCHKYMYIGMQTNDAEGPIIMRLSVVYLRRRLSPCTLSPKDT